jgi:hypothetical protein
LTHTSEIPEGLPSRAGPEQASRRRGRADQARADLDEALARFNGMGMTLWIERARSELDALA